VKRQYCGALGKIGNCQVAVASALIADGRPWPLAIDLYLPAEWLADADRRAKAGIPDTAAFREKWRFALVQVRVALKADFVIDGVVANADYGSTAAFRTHLEGLGLRYAVAIRGVVTFWTEEAQTPLAAATLADAIPPDQWQLIAWGAGTKRR
jgi:SRSO17 transposase